MKLLPAATQAWIINAPCVVLAAQFLGTFNDNAWK
jgi:hypothetical protein